MRLFLAILIGKAVLALTKLLKIGGGSAAPGYYALKIDPKLVEKLAIKVQNRVIITGTNGKTTTSRLLLNFARANNLEVLRNGTGSNLERGIASALISNSNVFGGLNNFDLSIWEVDEADFNRLVVKINPQIIVILNVLRDQLDRYGEIDSVVSKWHKTLGELDPKTLLLINNDDENLRGIGLGFKGPVKTFGLKDRYFTGEKSIGKKGVRTKTSLEAKNIIENGLYSTSFQLTMSNEQLAITLPVPGVYHIYDFLAAFFIGLNLKLPPSKMIASLKRFSPAFGRVEKIKLYQKEALILLIKNPFGATEVFKTIAKNLKKGDILFIALNDNLADGRDVSWIWDADFEQLAINNGQLTVIASGTRAEDLALRLYYAGFDKDSLIIENNIDRALNKIRKINAKRVFIMPTYTALLELQKILTKNKLKDHYWRED